MSIPDELNEILKKETSRLHQSVLSQAANDLSQRYRHRENGTSCHFMDTEAHRLAYLAVRMPATYAVVRRVLVEMRERAPEINVKNLLDLGAGPGTAAWAAVDLFPELNRISLVEKDGNLAGIGKKMMQNSSRQVLQSAVWLQKDLLLPDDLMEHDLVILSYVIGEMEPKALNALIARAWKASAGAIAIIEPGTPQGFERIRECRKQLILSGSHLLAPCPHQNECPMKDGDWCHFAERLERSTLHRVTKDVSLGYEDEKFSYLIAAKTPVKLPESRILRHPQKRSGHLSFTLCAQSGIQQRVISRKQGELYKKARKLDWGDSLEEQT